MATTTISGTAAVEDAMLFDGSAGDTNFGGGLTLAAGRQASGPFLYRSLVKFDASLIPAGTVDAMRMIFTQWRHSSSGGTAKWYKVLKSFVEGTSNGGIQVGSCTWNSREHGSLLWATPGLGDGTDYETDASPPEYVVPTGTGADAVRTVALKAAWASSARDTAIWCRIVITNAAVDNRLLMRSTEHASPPYFEVDVSAPAGLGRTLVILGRSRMR